MKKSSILLIFILIYLSVKAGSFDFELIKFECSESEYQPVGYVSLTIAQMLHGDSIPMKSCTLQLYLSTDTIIDNTDAKFCTNNHSEYDCYRFEHAWEGTLIQFKRDYKLPTPYDLSIEDYYIIAATDYKNQHDETNENNNILFVPIKIKGSATNDIYINNVSIDNTELSPQQGFSLSFDIHYSGDSESELNPILNLMYSKDSIWGNDVEDILVFTNSWIGSILSKSNPVDHKNWHLNLNAGLQGDYYLLIKTDWNDHYKEDDETNNCAYIKIFIEEELNDFWIKNVSCSEDKLQPGQHSTVITKARYNGNNHSEIETTIKQYLSKDTILDPSDYPICSNNYCRVATFKNANAGLQVYSNIKLPLELTAGEYYIISTIEPPVAIIETNTGNNSNYCKVNVTEPPTHDFYPSNFELSSNNMYSGSQFDISCILNYGGNTHSSIQSKLKVYFSADSIWDVEDIQISDQPDYENYGFNVNKRTENIFLITQLPHNLATGDYYILVVADPENQVKETNELNNVLSEKITVEEIVQDLIIDSFDPVKDSVYAGDYNVKVIITLRHVTNSPEPLSTTVHLYLSEDTILHNDVLDTTAIIYFEHAFNKSSRVEQTTYYIEIPDDIQPGDYYLIASIDDQNIIQETNENNNVIWSKLVVKENVVHDFGIENITISNDTLKPQENVSISFDQVYYGNYTEEMSSQYDIYFSADTIPDFTDLRACSNGCGSYDYSVSNPRQQCRRNLTIPASTQPGIYYFIIVVDYHNNYEETNEANNTVIVPIVVEEIYRDYFIDSLTLTPTSVPSFDYATAKICCSCDGNEAGNNNVTVQLRLSKNDIWGDADDYSFCNNYDCPDVYLGFLQKYTAEKQIFIPKDYEKGDYFLLAKIDGDNRYDETDESNNIISKAFKITGSALRDFYITDMVLSDTVVHPSAPLTLNYKHHYEGNSTHSLVGHVGLYVSRDTTLDDGDIQIKNGTEPFDAVGGSISHPTSTEYVTFTLPDQMELGEQYLILRADCDNQHDETNEDNNTTHIKIQVVEEEVDLWISQLQVNSDTIQIKGRVKADFIGNLTGNTLNRINFACRLYISNDSILDNSDTRVGTSYYYTLYKAREQVSLSLESEIPTSLQSGNKYLIVKIDEANDYSEPNETNNIIAYPIVVIPEPFHDFYISSAEPFNSKLQPLANFKLNFKYCYGGNSIDDVLSNLDLYLSTDSIFEPATDINLCRNQWSRLNAYNTQKDYSISFTIPEETKPGDYYLFLIADSKHEVDETNEDNNIFKIKVEVEDLYYDFSIDSVHLTPDSLQRGGGINVSYQINKKSNVKNTIQLRCGIYISNDSTWGYEDVQLDDSNFYIPETDNAYKVTDRYIKLPHYYEAGNYYLLFQADNNNQYDEESEDNNITVNQLNVVKSATRDFFIEDLTIQTEEIQPGSYFSVNLEHRYQGNSNDELSTKLQFRLSSDTIWDNDDDVVIGSNINSKHSINQPMVNIDRSLDIPATTKPGWYYLLLKTDYNNAHTETNEANNIFSTRIEIEEVISDLSIQNLHLSYDSAQAGGFLMASYDIVYEGNSIRDLYVRRKFIVSTDTILGNTDDLYLTNYGNRGFWMNRNDTLELFNDKVVFPDNLELGKYNIIIMADSDEDYEETNETNNITIAPFTVLPEATHDFYLSEFSTTIDTLQAHLQIPFEIAHNYSGNSISDVSAPINIYISSDSILGNYDDVMVHYYPNTEVNLNWETTTDIETGLFTIEDESFIGNKYLLIETDPNNVYQETDETNNILRVPVYIEEVVNDLVVGNIKVDPIQVQQQGSMKITYTLNYQGNSKNILLTNTQMLLSRDTIWNANTDVVICNNCGNSNFSQEIKEVAKTKFFNSTSELETGDYYVLVKIDHNNSINEINEENNTSFTKIEIIDKATRDFTISNLLVYKARVYPASSFNISYNFNYEGNSVDQLQAESRGILSTNKIWGDDDDIEITYNTVEHNFNRDELSREYVLKNLKIPYNIQPGKYQFLVKADCNDDHAEANEANNLSAFPIEVLDNEQDISIKNLTVDTDTVYSGNTVNLSGYYCLSSKSKISVYANCTYFLSKDNHFGNTDDIKLSEENIHIKYSATLRTKPLSIPDSVKSGTYYLYVKIDPNHMDTDKDRSNNLARIKVLVSDEGANDFYITDLKVEKDTFQIGEPINVDFNIHYNGNNQSMVNCDYMVALSNDSLWESYQHSKYKDFALFGRDSSVVHVSGILQTNYCDPNTDAYIQVKADYSKQFDETKETNNTVLQKISISNYPSLDIIISNFELATDSVCHNSKLKGSFDIEYIGDAAYDFSIPSWIVLSLNNVFGDMDDISISQQRINFIQGAEGVKKTIQVNNIIANSYIQPNNYHLFVNAGQLGDNDPNTDNNTLSNQITVVEQLKGDFSISNLLLETDTAFFYDYVDLEFTIQKQNNIYTFDHRNIDVCLSTDTIWGNEDDISRYLMYYNSESVEDILQKTEKCQLSISENIAPGNYYVIIKIDAYDQFEEQDENNNTIYSPIIINESTNDFYVTNFNVQPYNDSLFTISGVIQNNGNNHIFLAPHINLYISANDELNDADDLYQFMLPMNSLSYSELGTFSFNSDILNKVSKGKYYLILEITDYYYDSDISNNISVASFEIECNSSIVHEFVDLCGDETYLEWTTEGDHRRVLTSQGGCDSIVYTHLRAFENPEKPSFSIDGDCLYSSSSEWNQWYFEQSKINGANDSVYCINQNGNYAVRLIDEFGCKSEISEYIFINYSNITIINTDIVAYPNPTKGILYISGLSNSTSTVITIYNLNGKSVKQEKISTEDRLIDIRDQPNGVYFIKFNNETHNVIRIIKN